MGEVENQTMEDELIADLTAELEVSDEKFNASLLASKVKNAIREVRTMRRYPITYTEDMITRDLKSYYSQCRALALYDYNKIGGEFETDHTEDSNRRSFVAREKLFSGVIPLARL